MERVYNSGAALKAMARGRLLGKYGLAVFGEMAVSLLKSLAIYIITNVLGPQAQMGSILYGIISVILVLIFSVFSLGLCCLYLNIISGQNPSPRDVFAGFRGFADKAISAKIIMYAFAMSGFLPALAAALWYNRAPGNQSLGFLVGMSMMGLILASGIMLGFSQVYYVILDFPDLNVREALLRSTELMRGKKLKLLFIIISFAPYLLLGVLSAGIAFLWIKPYINATLAEFYLDIA